MAITKITTPELFDFSATNTALQLPTGTTAQRPTSPSAGEWRFNTTEKYVEYYDGAAWFQIDTEAPATPDDFPSQNFNVNTYTGTGATQTIDAKFNEAANFNGSSSVIETSITASLFNTNTWSLSLWFKQTNNTPGYFLGNTNNNLSNGIAMTFYIAGSPNGGSRFDFITRNANSTVGRWQGGTQTLNVWTNLVIVNNNNSFSFYQDGSLASSTSGYSQPLAGGSYSSNDNFVLGKGGLNYNAEYFGGMIDQVRYFNTALTAAQAEDLYTDETTTTAATLNFPAGAGCIAAYQLDGDASDISGTYGGVETDIGYTGLKFQPDMIWTKSRSNPLNHTLFDSVRGTTKSLRPNSDTEEQTRSGVTSFNSNGFTIGTDDESGGQSGYTYVSWCFKAGGAPTATNSQAAGNPPTPDSVLIDGVSSTAALAGTLAADKISANTKNGFSIVKFTSSGSASTVGHGLSATPELIFAKGLVGFTSPWATYSSTTGATKRLDLNLSAAASSSGVWNNTAPTSSVFSQDFTSTSGRGIIAYCFHSVANYQKIGSYTGTSASGNIISTEITSGDGGFEPAFLMIKRTDASGGWMMVDNKRSTSNPRTKYLTSNTSDAEGDAASIDVDFLTNGFSVSGTNSDINVGTYIYLAIAADKDSSVPTQANSFSPTIYTGNGGTQNIYTPFAPDFTWIKNRNDANGHAWFDSVRGAGRIISSNSTVASSGNSRDLLGSFNPNGFQVNRNYLTNTAYDTTNGSSSLTYVSWNWKAGGLPTINSDGTRTSIVSANAAAGFSIVKWTGDGAAATIGHGLGGAPGLIIVKKLTGTSDWPVYSSGLTSAAYRMLLNDTGVENTTNDEWNSTDPTTVSPFVFSVGNGGNVSDNGQSFIGYCFADIAGYQKVGTYTGAVSGSTPGTVISTSVNGDSGFLPRFVMVKVIDFNNEDWHIYDSTRGGGNSTAKDLLPNKSSAETDFSTRTVNFVNNGFYWSFNNGDPAINNSPLTYIFLAIA